MSKHFRQDRLGVFASGRPNRKWRRHEDDDDGHEQQTVAGGLPRGPSESELRRIREWFQEQNDLNRIREMNPNIAEAIQRQMDDFREEIDGIPQEEGLIDIPEDFDLDSMSTGSSVMSEGSPSDEVSYLMDEDDPELLDDAPDDDSARLVQLLRERMSQIPLMGNTLTNLQAIAERRNDRKKKEDATKEFKITSEGITVKQPSPQDQQIILVNAFRQAQQQQQTPSMGRPTWAVPWRGPTGPGLMDLDKTESARTYTNRLLEFVTGTKIPEDPRDAEESVVNRVIDNFVLGVKDDIARAGTSGGSARDPLRQTRNRMQEDDKTKDLIQTILFVISVTGSIASALRIIDRWTKGGGGRDKKKKKKKNKTKKRSKKRKAS